MKRFLATGVAAAVAMTAFAALPSAANAGGWHGGPYYNGYYYPPPPPPQRYYYYPQPYYHYDPGPAIVAGVIGTFLGAVINQRHHKVYRKKRH